MTCVLLLCYMPTMLLTVCVLWAVLRLRSWAGDYEEGDDGIE